MRFADTSSDDNIEKHENYASDLRNVLSLDMVHQLVTTYQIIQTLWILRD